MLAWVAGVALLLPCTVSPLVAQRPVRVGGHAVRVTGTDTLPLGRAPVVLHRLGAAFQGPIDSAFTDPDGRFEFRARPDTASVLLVTALYSGIEYTSRPVRLLPSTADTTLLVVAADTSSAAPVVLGARFLVVNRAAQGGVRGALDLIVLQNRGRITRVAADTGSPVFRMRMPGGLAGFHVEDGEISPAAVALSGDTMGITSPFPPGERQLIVTYTLPTNRDRYVVPLEHGADSVVVLLEEPGARVTSPGFAPTDSALIDGRTYRRWVGTHLAPGQVVIRLPSPGTTSTQVPYALAALLGLALLATALWVFRRPAGRPGARQAAAGPSPAMLIEQLARLDQQYAGREGEVGADAWAQYRARRAQLLTDYAAAQRPRP